MSSIYPVTIFIRHSHAKHGCFFAELGTHDRKDARRLLRVYHAQLYLCMRQGDGWVWYAETGR